MVLGGKVLGREDVLGKEGSEGGVLGVSWGLLGRGGTGGGKVLGGEGTGRERYWERKVLGKEYTGKGKVLGK